jgi:hypothetical protein
MKCFDETTHDIVARGTLAWACARMIEGPMVEYSAGPGTTHDGTSRHRWHKGHSWFETFADGNWQHDGYCFTYSECNSLSWHPVAPEKKEPEPGGHDWLYSLPNGTEVERNGVPYQKHGNKLFQILDGTVAGPGRGRAADA